MFPSASFSSNASKYDGAESDSETIFCWCLETVFCGVERCEELAVLDLMNTRRPRMSRALNGVELPFPGGAGCTEEVCLFCFFCQVVSNHCVCRIPTTLQIGNTHENTVRRQICCLLRANGVIVVVSGPPWCPCFSDWCAPGCSAKVDFGCASVRRTLPAWLTSLRCSL